MSHRETHTLPSIVISRADHALLQQLANAGTDIADDLLAELERAQIVEDAALPSNVVRMGSVVGYSVDGGTPVVVTLVYPEHADISSGKISVLTPIGAALIGLKPGQSFSWSARDGKRKTLTVITVFAANGADPAPRPGPRPVPRLDPDDPGPTAA